MEVSLAFWREEARCHYDPGAPSVEDRIAGLHALHTAGIPLVLRIDPLFPRSPLPTKPPTTVADFGLPEAQTLDDLEQLVTLAKELQVRHVVYSPAPWPDALADDAGLAEGVRGLRAPRAADFPGR